uniref:Ion transport domain-containing protein n=1 Tax=Romanomermis culicivorax TaxID=13658 RepID=A0A915JMB6_ROMCU
LLILASQRINYDSVFSLKSNYTERDPDRKERRGLPPTPVEWAIMAWIIGLIWVEVKQLWDSGLYEYAHNMWNILDFITNSLYVATITLRFVAYL